MRKLLILAATGLALAGCNTNLNPNVATPAQAGAWLGTYNIAVAGARAYLASPLCVTKSTAQPLCQEVYSSLVAARAARKQISAALAANQSAPITAVQAIEAAYAVFQQIPQTF